MKKVAILIPVFNNLAFTKKCIKRLLGLILDSSLHHVNYSIVVIDDGSSDGTSEWIKNNHPEPEVYLVSGDGSLWWSGGINRGTEYSLARLKADFLLLWNNDIHPADDYFLQLDALVGSSIDKQTVAGSKIFYLDRDKENVIWSFGGFFNPKSGKKYMLGYNAMDSEEFATQVSVDWLPGMGTLVPKEVVEKIGLWDEEVFPQYHGDSDYTFRAKTAGYRIISFPQLRLWNDKSVSGLDHMGSFKGLIQVLTKRRSNSNIRDNFRFYKRHSKSVWAYRALLPYYFRLLGGFFKWKILSLFGLRKK